jgi:hypothetical protein
MTTQQNDDTSSNNNNNNGENIIDDNKDFANNLFFILPSAQSELCPARSTILSAFAKPSCFFVPPGAQSKLRGPKGRLLHTQWDALSGCSSSRGVVGGHGNMLPQSTVKNCFYVVGKAASQQIAFNWDVVINVFAATDCFSFNCLHHHNTHFAPLTLKLFVPALFSLDSFLFA